MKKKKVIIIVASIAVVLAIVALIGIVVAPKLKVTKEAETLDSRIAELCNEYSAEDYDRIIELSDECEKVDDEVLEKMTKVEMLYDAVDNVSSMKAQAVVDEIIEDVKNGSALSDGIYSKILEYSPLMDEDQIRTCIQFYACSKSITDVEDTLKEKYIVSPRSYCRYSSHAKLDSSRNGSEYEIYRYEVTLTFSTENTFGAEKMYDDMKLIAVYRVNISSLSVELSNVEFCDIIDGYNASLYGRFL